MARSTAARAEARFKQLCCLGLGGEAVITALIYELHAIIPFFSASFSFADERGALANVCFDNPDIASITPLYLQVFLNKRDRELPGNSYADAMRWQFGVHDLAKAVTIDPATFHRSDMYNLIYRRIGYELDFLRLVVRERGRGRGMLTLYRSPGTRPWSSEDKRQLAALESFFVHALTSDSKDDVPLIDSGRSGLIVADPNGKPLFFSPEGERLLLLAAHSRIAADTAFSAAITLPHACRPPLPKSVPHIFGRRGRFSAGLSLQEPLGWIHVPGAMAERN